MTFSFRAIGLLPNASWFGVTGTANAADYKPELAHPGKDVAWVPTPDALVNRMLDLARVTASDHVIDLGARYTGAER